MPKKSRSQKKKRPPGVDPNELRRQRLEARRAARAEAEAAKLKAQQRERWIRRAALAALFLVAVWFVFLRGRAPSEIEGHELLTFASSGVNDHTDDPVSYEMTPPVSGAHAQNPATCGTHAEQIPNENQVHSLEHGAVGIQYETTVDPATIAEIEALVSEFDENVFSAPYTGMPTPITVSSWSRMMRLEEFDESAVREYIDTFAGEGPESGARPCTNEEDDSFEPEPTASPTPEPTESPKKRSDGKGKDE